MVDGVAMVSGRETNNSRPATNKERTQFSVFSEDHGSNIRRTIKSIGHLSILGKSFLLLGAVPFPRDVYRLKELGVEAVVTLNEAYETLVPTSMYRDKGINHLVIPTRDYLFAPSFDDIRNAVEFIHEHVKSGKTTYVHCKAGRGRSTTIVLCYLVEHKGMTPVGAYEYVRLKRPRVLLATSQWQAVKEYNERIHGNCKTLIAPGSSLPLQCPVPLALSQRALTPDEGDRSFCYDDSVVFVTSADLDGYSSSDDACLVDTAYGVSKRCCDKDVNIDCTFKTI